MTDSARRGQGSKGFLSWSQLLGREATALPSKKRRRRSTIASRRQRALEGLERRVLLSATPTSITVSASASSAVYGQAVNLTADVSASPSEGNVSFFDNGALLATAQPVTSGIARLDNIQLAAETHSITASYSDTAGTFAASSTTVGPNSTTTTVAGNGAFGFSGDGGPATAAELASPTGVE